MTPEEFGAKFKAFCRAGPFSQKAEKAIETIQRLEDLKKSVPIILFGASNEVKRANPLDIVGRSRGLLLFPGLPPGGDEPRFDSEGKGRSMVFLF